MELYKVCHGRTSQLGVFKVPQPRRYGCIPKRCFLNLSRYEQFNQTIPGNCDPIYHEAIRNCLIIWVYHHLIVWHSWRKSTKPSQQFGVWSVSWSCSWFGELLSGEKLIAAFSQSGLLAVLPFSISSLFLWSIYYIFINCLSLPILKNMKHYYLLPFLSHHVTAT